MRAELFVGLAIAGFVACVQVDVDSPDVGGTGGSASESLGGASPGTAGASGTPSASAEAGAAGVTNGIGGAAGNTSMAGAPSGGDSGIAQEPDASTGESGAAGDTGSAGAAGAAGDAGSSTDAGTPADAATPDASVVPPGACHADDSGVVLVYTDRSSALSSDQLTLSLSVSTTVPASRLSELSLRYWFNADGVADFTGDIDYASIGGTVVAHSDVTVAFGSAPHSDYAQLSFELVDVQSDPVVLDEIQLRLHSSDYALLDQRNDFSFLQGASAASNRNISVYLAGELIAGCEPQ